MHCKAIHNLIINNLKILKFWSYARRVASNVEHPSIRSKPYPCDKPSFYSYKQYWCIFDMPKLSNTFNKTKLCINVASITPAMYLLPAGDKIKVQWLMYYNKILSYHYSIQFLLHLIEEPMNKIVYNDKWHSHFSLLFLFLTLAGIAIMIVNEIFFRSVRILN